MAVPKKDPVVTSLGATVTLATDTTLRVISTWGYKTAPPIFPDSTRVKVGLGQSPPVADKGHFVIWPQVIDTSFVTISAYGTITGYTCVVPHRGTTWGAQTCTNWTYIRLEPPVPPFDTMTAKVASVIVRPQGVQVDIDSNTIGRGACATWQAANPTKSVWVKVNVQAVPECTGAAGHPIVAQFCAFYVLTDSSTGITTNAGQPGFARYEYCKSQYDQWLTERGA